MVDAPCGGMAWMPHLLTSVIEEDQPDFKYFGADIVPSVIKANQEKFAANKAFKFDVLDITEQIVPGGYELIHCRDALQHLSMHMIAEALRNFSKSSARLLLVGSYGVSERLCMLRSTASMLCC